MLSIFVKNHGVQLLPSPLLIYRCSRKSFVSWSVNSQKSANNLINKRVMRNLLPLNLSMTMQTNSQKPLKTLTTNLLLKKELKITKDTKLYELTYRKDLWTRHVMSLVLIFVSGYFGLFLYFLSQNPPKIISNSEDLSPVFVFMGKFTQTIMQYANWLSGGIFLFAFVNFISVAYSLRFHVFSAILKAGGKNVELLVGGDNPSISKCRKQILPLSELSCIKGRAEKGDYILIKQKGKKRNLIIDKRGNFPNPVLFDTTLGLYRKI